MLIIGMSAFGQSRELDSLKSLLKDASGNRKAHLLNEMAVRVTDEEALPYYAHAIAEASDSVILARAISNTGISLYRMGRTEEAEKLLEAAIPAFEKISAAAYYTESMYGILGKINMYTGSYSSAFELFYKNLRLVNERHDSLLVGYQLNDLALLYYKVRDNKRALALYSEASKYAKGDSSIQFLAHMNSSLCWSELGLPSQALLCCDRAFVFANGMPKNLLHLEFAIGFAQLKRGCTDAAKEMFGKSLHRSIELENKRMEGENLLYLSKALIAESMLDSAYQLLIRAEKLAGDNNFKEILLDIYRGVIEVAGRRKQFFQLATYQQKYIQLKEDVYSIELEKSLASLEGEWYESVNGQVIDSQKLEIDDRYNALRYQQWISVTLCLIVLLVGFIIGIYLRGIYLQRRSQVLLEAQVYSRVKRLKPLGLLHSHHVDLGRNDQIQELNDAIRQCRRNLFKLIKKTPEMLLDDSVVKYFSRREADYSGSTKVRHDQSSPIPTKG